MGEACGRGFRSRPPPSGHPPGAALPAGLSCVGRGAEADDAQTPAEALGVGVRGPNADGDPDAGGGGRDPGAVRVRGGGRETGPAGGGRAAGLAAEGAVKLREPVLARALRAGLPQPRQGLP